MPTRPTIRQLAAVALGNGLEFYDFLIFAFFATQIGATFFPVHDEYGRLLLTLATFGVGFLTRPLGGFFIGRMGDRLGRKPAMLLSFGLMGLSIVALALTPSYARIGWPAPVLAVLCRLVQGFALGGDVGPVSAFLLEASPPAERGRYITLQQTTQYVSTFVAGLLGFILAGAMSPAALSGWGWRVAFLMGAAVVPFGLWARGAIGETFHAPAGARAAMTRAEWRVGVLGIFILAGSSISIYVMNYLTTYAINTLGMPARQAFVATAAVGVSGTVMSFAGGMLSDRIGRKPVMIGGGAVLLAVTLPMFLAISAWRSMGVLAMGAGLMTSLLALTQGPVLASIAENLPQGLRSGGMGLIYALEVAIFGGSAQFVVTWLIHVTGNPLAPAWYMSGALAVGLVAMTQIPESAPVKVGA